MLALPDHFEPDEITLELLGSEHNHGTWVGRELLPIANRIRNQGGSYDDYIRWTLASTLWTSYGYSTSDKVRDQERHLESAWAKAERSKPFDLEEWLTDLYRRIAAARWTGRAGSRNREVALAFVGFCIEHNCFTRTISQYELSKYTSGLSPSVVNRALADLVEIGLLRRLVRDDLTRQSKRSTSRYRINLYWQGQPQGQGQLSVTALKNTGKHSLGTLRTNGPHDLWSSRGLGLTAGRVHEALTDDPATLAEVAARAGVTRQSAHRALAKLADACLAGVMPCRPARYFAVETPLGVLAEAIGCGGYVERRIAATEILQAENREKYAGSYRHDTRSPEPEVRRQVPRPRAKHVPPPPEEWFEPLLRAMNGGYREEVRTVGDPFVGAPVDGQLCVQPKAGTPLDAQDHSPAVDPWVKDQSLTPEPEPTPWDLGPDPFADDPASLGRGEVRHNPKGKPVQFNVSLDALPAAIQAATPYLVGDPVPGQYEVLEDEDARRDGIPR